MKFTLLEMTQEILQSMESDEVNSISDTVESYAVAVLLRSVYYDLAIDLGLPEHETLFELDASGDATKPVLMTIPDTVALVRNIKYNIKTATETNSNYRDLIFKPFVEFMTDQNNLRNQTTNVGQMTFIQNSESFEVMYMTDQMPRYFTTMDDRTFLFDSYDSTIDTTLQKSKTLCMGVIYPTFSLTDGFIPDLDPSQFSLLKNRAKVRAFAEFKQVPNQEAASEARRQKIIVQKRKRTTPDLDPIFNLPRYGRRDGFNTSPIPKTLKQSW
jgi:hypothetical protein